MKKVLVIKRRLLNQEGSPGIAKDFCVSKQAIQQIANGQTWRHVTGFNRFSLLRRVHGGPRKRLKHKSDQCEEVPWTKHKLRTSLLDRIARRLIEDPPFQVEFFNWWINRGEEVIKRDGGAWARLVNRTFHDYCRNEEAAAVKNMRIMQLLKSKKGIDFASGSNVEWRVRYGTTQAGRGLSDGAEHPAGPVSLGDRPPRESHHGPHVEQQRRLPPILEGCRRHEQGYRSH